MKTNATRAERQEFHTAEMKARRERQLARTVGFEPSGGAFKGRTDKGRAEQRYRMHKTGGGYDVLHATKGWRRVSGRRLAAQTRMAQMLEGTGQGGFMSQLVASMKARFAEARENIAANDQNAEAA